MQIRTRAYVAAAVALGALALVAASLAWAQREAEAAGRQRDRTAAIMLALGELRLVTFEYLMRREERPREQWGAVSLRLDGLLAGRELERPEALDIVKQMRMRRAVTKGLFAEIARAGGGAAERRFEDQALARLLVLQQESYADAFRLDALAAARASRASLQQALVSGTGLALGAALALGALAFFLRQVLAPLGALTEATREVARGRWEVRLPAPRDDEMGVLTANFAAMLDALRRMVAGLEEKNRELAALNGELEAFSYSVSHDLRTPLRAMDGFSQALLEDWGTVLDAEGRDALERIRAASQRMGRLIDDLLGLARVTRAELALREVDLSALAWEAADALQQSEPARHVRWKIDEGLHARADPALLRIAFANLLANAWKFTAQAAAPEIRVGACELEGVPGFFVADNGVGFDMAHAGGLFGAFVRLHHAHEFPGTGIGLAIVGRVVRRHGGRIRAEAAPGRGATFRFTLGGPPA